MSGVIALLLFSSVATTLALWLCLFVGSLTSWIAWGSFFVASVVGSWVFIVLKRMKFETPKPTWVDGWVFFCFILFCLRQFLWIYFRRMNGLWTLNPCNYGDLPYHITNIRYFVRGAEFWPDDPIFAASKLHYPFGMDFFTALWVQVGVPLERALPLIGVIAGILVMFALFWWGRSFTLAAFLFSGSIGGYFFFLTGVLENYQADFAWKNLPLTLLVPQRGFLYAFPAGLILLWSWRRRFLLRQKPLPVPIEGLLWGLMPLFHMHTFLFLSFVFAVWTVVSKSFNWNTFRIFLWAYLPATMEILPLTNFFQLLSVLSWRPGWLMKGENLLTFLLCNFGLFVPLLILTVLFVGLKLFQKNIKRDEKTEIQSCGVLLGTSLAFWFLTFFVMFAPWPWDNIKLMAWCYLLLLPAIDKFVIRRVHVLWRILLLTVLFAPGFITVIDSLKVSNKGAKILSIEEYDEIRYMTRDLDPQGTFVMKPHFNHPILLCGFKAAAGDMAHLWSHGVQARGLNEKIRKLMLGKPGWQQLVKDLQVRYLFWGLREEKEYSSSSKPWEEVSLKIGSGQWGDLYDLSEVSLLE